MRLRGASTKPPRHIVSIHALNEECDKSTGPSKGSQERFQSTHSMKSATPFGLSSSWFYKFQSTHSMKSATCKPSLIRFTINVSIHALNEECDVVRLVGDASGYVFQSTHSMKSATLAVWMLFSTKLFQSTHSMKSATACFFCLCFQGVSIHALNEECDRQHANIRQR